MKRGVIILRGVIDLHQQEEVGVRKPGNPLGCLLALPCLTVTVNRHVQPLQTEKGTMIKNLDPSGMKFNTNR